jgi:hypothetical protein
MRAISDTSEDWASFRVLGLVFSQLLRLALATGEASDAIIADYEDAVRLSPPPQKLPAPTWIRHPVGPRERVTWIAARYGVSRDDLVEWNELEVKNGLPTKRKSLRVLTDRMPPPAFEVSYTVRAGDTWDEIAARFRVERIDLKALNWKVRELAPGKVLRIWVDPGRPRTVRRGASGREVTPPAIGDGGKSTGRPQRGRIENAVQLPETELYIRGHPGRLWGSSHTVRQVVRAFEELRERWGYEGTILIGAMSRRHGGRMPPHRSHQSGRDIDVRMPVLPGVPRTRAANQDEIDWEATWALVRGFVATGEVEVIFLDIQLHRRLYEAARALGESREDIAAIIEWPNWRGNGRPLVRHSEGHVSHIHVRIRCADDEPKCRS